MELENKAADAETSTSTRLKVLIADDDPPTRILLRAAIAQWGYEAVEANDGEEAWKILQNPETAPRLLILDWLMPKMDGAELCARIRKELSFHPYIILLTQIAGTANIILGLEAGADEFLSKPFKMAELRSRLSVGARIIKYENMLSAQNTHLKKENIMLDEIKKLTEDALKVNADKKIETSLKTILEITNKLKNRTDTK